MNVNAKGAIRIDFVKAIALDKSSVSKDWNFQDCSV